MTYVVFICSSETVFGSIKVNQLIWTPKLTLFDSLYLVSVNSFTYFSSDRYSRYEENYFNYFNPDWIFPNITHMESMGYTQNQLYTSCIHFLKPCKKCCVFNDVLLLNKDNLLVISLQKKNKNSFWILLESCYLVFINQENLYCSYCFVIVLVFLFYICLILMLYTLPFMRWYYIILSSIR